MDEVLGIPLSVATPSALALSSIALIIVSYSRGWILSSTTVKSLLEASDKLIADANKRVIEWRELYEIEKVRGSVLEEVVEQLKIVGQTSAKILNALPPIPQTGDAGEGVER